MDRRKLIFAAASLGVASCALGWVFGGGMWPLMAAAFMAGGVTTPLYALFLAYTIEDFDSSIDEFDRDFGRLSFGLSVSALGGRLSIR